MADKPFTVPAEKVCPVIGRLSDQDMLALTRQLAFMAC